MKPRVFDYTELPEAVRAPIERELYTLSRDMGIENADKERRATQCIATHLFSTDPALLNHPVLTPLQQALLDMQTGDGTPAVQIDHLPKQSQLFILGLFGVLQSDMRERVPRNRIEVGNTFTLHFHQDEPYYPMRRKLVRGLLCENPGAKPQPTIFVTADEAIHACVCAELGMFPNSDAQEIAASGKTEEYATIRERWITDLSTLMVHSCSIYNPETKQNEWQTQPFLHRNPNYREGCGAPEFLVCGPDYINQDIAYSIPDAAHYKQFTAFTETLRTLRHPASEESQASLQKHSAVLWNDALVYHDRGVIRDDLQGPDYQGERTLLSLDAKSSYADIQGGKGGAFQAAPPHPTHNAVASPFTPLGRIAGEKGQFVS